jgi:hypothetical protein
MNRDPWWLAVADRVYALALHLYPRAFRETWGTQMRQAMRDRWRECAKDGRGAFGAAFALFPDLATSAGKEHLHAFGEEVAMKRVLLGSALALSVALFAMQGRISAQVAAWQDARTWKAVDTAYRDALRQAASASPEPAIRALAWTLDDPGTRVPTSREAGASARGAAADGYDRLAGFLAAARCGDDAALARLEAADPGNGAAWAVAATCALRAKRPASARQALARLAQSDHYDSRSGDLLAAATDLLKRVPEPSVFMSSNSPTGLDFLGNMLWNAHTSEFEAVVRLCVPPAKSSDASLAADCRAAAGMLSRADSDWVRQFGTVLVAKFDGSPLDKAVLRERDADRQQALATWWALDDATRTARIASGGSEIDLLRD